MYSKEIHLYINFYTMKTKTNAVDIYLISEEAKKWLIWNNLNLKDLVIEKIDFLESVKDSNIFIKWVDDFFVKISKYENSKNYEFPIDILIREEEEKKEEVIEEKIKKIDYKNYIIIILTIFIFIFWIIFFWKINKQEIKVDQFDSMSQKIEIENKNILNELRIQKELRILINNSIEKVKVNQKNIDNLKKEIILYSNN